MYAPLEREHQGIGEEVPHHTTGAVAFPHEAAYPLPKEGSGLPNIGIPDKSRLPEMLLPSDPVERKGIPITSGVLDYFPLAIAEVARVSKAGSEQHHPGQPLHWDKEKSTDHADCIPRHLIDRGRRDTDGMRHSAKLAWRALALLEIELENEAAR